MVKKIKQEQSNEQVLQDSYICLKCGNKIVFAEHNREDVIHYHYTICRGDIQ